MQKWKLRPLGKLGKIVSGSTPRTTEKEYWGGDIPWITPADLTKHEGIFFKGKLRKITQAGFESCSTAMIPTGSILFSSRAPIGHCAVTTYPLCTNQGFKSIIPNVDELDSIYGFFALKFFTPQIVNQGRGATFSEVNKEIMENFCIPVPPIEEQQRIAGILARADRLRQLRRYALQLSEGYLQSVFLQMFGDPVTNPMGWESTKLRNVCLEITVGYVGPMTHEYIQSGIPFLRSQNVRPYHLDLSDVKYVSVEFHRRLKKSALSPGDVAVVRTGNAGTAAVIPPNLSEANCADLVIIRPSAKINNQYLTTLFNSTWGKGSVSGNLVGQIQQHFNIGAAKEMVVHLPPIELQQKYAQIVQQFERLRAQQHEATRQADHLFATLLHRAFRGEL